MNLLTGMMVTSTIPRVLLICLLAVAAGAWGPRGHQNANRAAMKSLPADGPVFLREFEDWIASVGR